MTIENQTNLNRIRNPVLAQLSEEARNVESQSRCNSKAWICYGNAIIAITLFIFSFCSIVFIIIFVEYEVIENSIEHHTLTPSPLDSIHSTGGFHPHSSSSTTARTTTRSEADRLDEEKSVEKAILDAIDNRPTEDDDPEEARLNQFDNMNLNMTKINVSSTSSIATVSETDPGKFLHYMTKSEWQTDEPTPPPSGNVMQAAQKLLPLPTRRVIVSHTGGKTCNSTVKTI